MLWALCFALFGSCVLAQPTCTPAPANLVSWWQAEGDGQDAIGGNSGILSNGVSFAAGEVGQAFNFNGINSFIEVSDSPSLRLTNELTIEFWVKRQRLDNSDFIVEKGGDWTHGTQNYGVALHVASFNYCLHFLFAGGWRGAGSIGDLNWHYCAITARNGDADPIFYIDGAQQPVLFGEGAATINLYPSTSPLHIGAQLDFNYNYYGKNLIDELGLYNRALSESEILAIYAAGSSGKCPTTNPPTILSQPTNQTVTVGSTATFAVSAAGTAPLSYQWWFNNALMTGRTNMSLTLASVQSSNSGNYFVVVSNIANSIASSNALLTVTPPPPCVPSPSGLVGWWKAEGDASDAIGGNFGALSNGVAFASGKVGQAFAFNGINSFVQVPDSPSLRLTNELTIEFWVKRQRLDNSDFILEKGGDWTHGTQNYGVALHVASFNYCLHFLFAGGWRGAGSIGDLNWHYCAITARNGDANPIFYIDGAQQPIIYSQGAGAINLYPSALPLHIGAQLDFNDYGKNLIDELGIYNRALSASELQAIYLSGASGKCATTNPPVIISQPANQTATLGNTVLFNASAAGTPPFMYQWAFKGTNIAGATINSLTLTNVQFNQSGNYSMTVSNAFGHVTSSNALLTVNFPPARARVVSTGAAAGGNVMVPVELVANGNENALGFSLNFDTTKLTYANIILGSGAAGAALMPNTSLINSGKLGIGVALPPGAVFNPGTQQVVQVNFVVAVLTNSTSTSITFGDQPTPRQLLDANINNLPATYSSATISISAATDFEGDVFPRPAGDKYATLSDWLVMGRYAARLDYPTNAAEFQRADCAPRSTLGDGTIRITDWVQAGRYASGLDPLTPIGGPTNEIAVPGAGPSATRLASLGNALLTGGQTGTVSVTLAAQGNENALGFSLSFNAALAMFQGATLGAGANGGTLYVNTNQIASGRLGFALALGSGSSFTAGSQETVRVNFQAVSSASGTFSLTFTDLPVPREISDISALALPASYGTSTITVTPLPSLRIARSQQNVILAWPLWASNFVVQQTDAIFPTTSWTNPQLPTIISNNETMVTLPPNGVKRFYRLQHP